jgi:hypothetical protein
MYRCLLSICVLALLIAPCIAQDAEYKPPRRWTFGSMGVALRADLEVFQGGARDEAGEIVIKEKDRLLKWNGTDLKTLDDFCRQLYASKPNDIVEVEISRPKAEGDERETLTVKIKLADPKVAYKELYTHLDKRTRSYDWRKNLLVTEGGPLRAKVWPLIEKHDLFKAWSNLTAAHDRELDLWNSYENLSSTDLLLSDPQAAHQWIAQVGGDFARSGGQGFPLSDLRTVLLHLLDVERSAVEEPERKPAKGEADVYAQALAKLIAPLAPVMAAGKVADWDETCARIEAFEFAWRGEAGFTASAQAVDDMRAIKLDSAPVILNLSSLLHQIDVGAGMFRDEFPQAAVPKGIDMSTFVEGEAVCLQTAAGLVAIGGAERNVWKAVANMPAVILDVGGDDEYVDCAVTGGEYPVSIVIDRGGNDHYRSTRKWGVACGMLGTAIVDDHDGNDTYECGDWGIGAAFGGIGLLIDRKGNDRYLGGTNSIGCAAYGVGGVIDLEGNDLYDSHTMSVGVGQPGGVGFVLDHAGDDRYRCNGAEPSGYGTEGEWTGWGIGCGFGWRTLACGGIGLVVDVAGNDIYDAGEFGLGCGYFMAIGAVRDMDGDDIYHSSRYGLAAAAHAGVGLFMDDKGNDTYEGKTAASIGGVWDIVTGYFYDGAGDDNYRCDGLGLGACAQNGFGIFWDAGGADNYRGSASTIGNAGSAEYGGGRLAKNFGIFIDSGGGKDNYPRDDRKNGSEIVEQEYAIFLDE